MVFKEYWFGSAANESTSNISQIVFTIIFVAIVVGWIVVALFTRALDNFTFHVLNLNDKSFWDTLLIAVFMLIFFSVFVWVIDIYNLVSGGLRSQYAGANDPLLAQVSKDQQDTVSTLRRFTGSRNVALSSVFPRVVFR